MFYWYFKSNLQFRKQYSVQTCISFLCLWSDILLAYFHVQLFEADLVTVLCLVVADCEDEELACCWLGWSCEELAQAWDTASWLAQDACTKWRHPFHVGWILSYYCSCHKPVPFRPVPMSCSGGWEGGRFLPSVENNQRIVNQVRNLPVLYMYGMQNPVATKKRKSTYLIFSNTPHHWVSHMPNFSRSKKWKKIFNFIYWSNKVYLSSICKDNM